MQTIAENTALGLRLAGQIGSEALGPESFNPSISTTAPLVHEPVNHVTLLVLSTASKPKKSKWGTVRLNQRKWDPARCLQALSRCRFCCAPESSSPPREQKPVKSKPTPARLKIKPRNNRETEACRFAPFKGS
ncbi:hypothetical protein ON010_g13816 [Phytophthora cinnamomi]|nr:hypothetical protein ON010_g13816 [Phytophthora cinnamomi]